MKANFSLLQSLPHLFTIFDIILFLKQTHKAKLQNQDIFVAPIWNINFFFILSQVVSSHMNLLIKTAESLHAVPPIMMGKIQMTVNLPPTPTLIITRSREPAFS